jgi:hypothetical protein
MARGLFVYVYVLGLATPSCGPKGGTDSSSNWLEPCVSDADCPLGGSCVCGLCTLECDAEEDCETIRAGLSCGVPSGCEAGGPPSNYCYRGDEEGGDDDAPVQGSGGESPSSDPTQSSGDGGSGEGGSGATSQGGAGGDVAGGGTAGASPSTPSGGASTAGGSAGLGGTASGGVGSGGGAGNGGTANAGSGGTPDVPSQPATGLCSTGAWCWENPQPQGHWIYDMATIGDELWAAVDHGTVLRRQGDTWERFELAPEAGVQVQAWSIWGATPDDVWVGTQWTGDTGGVLHRYQAGAWQSFPSPTTEIMFGMWGSSATDIWAVGWAGTIMHFDGTEWTLAEVPEDATERLEAVYGFAPDDVWVVGSAERILHYDGQSWTTARSSPVSQLHLRSVWGSAPNDIWAVGGDTSGDFSIALHYDGVEWTETRGPSLEALQTVIGSADGEVWATGSQSLADASTLYRVEGGEFVEFLTGVPGQYVTAANTPGGETWFGGETGMMLRYTGGTWGSVGSTITYNATLQAAWMADDGSLGFTVGYRVPNDGILLRWNGTGWLQDSYARTSAQSLLSIHGTSPDDVWMTGSGQLFHFDGADWTELDSPVSQGVSRVFASAPDDVWLAGVYSGVNVLHYDGTAWTPVVDGPMTSLDRLWSPTRGELWVLGSNAFHFDGATWTEFATTSEFGDATDMWGSAPDDAWLVGNAGAIHHYDGAAFTAVPSPVTTNLLRVYGRSPDDIYAVGALGTILHYDGSEWSVEASGTTLDFNDVAFTPDSVQVVAHGTAILKKALP